jgi:regulatory protein
MAKRPPQTLDREKLLNVALRALGGRAHSSGELREKLRRRAQSQEDVDAVLAKLKEGGYLNDQRFAEAYAAARLQDQGLGKMRVLRDLRQRRVAPKLAEQVTEQTYQQTNEADLIEQFLRRKYRGKELGKFFSEEKNLAAAFRRLRYAGFSAGQSIKVLKRFAAQPEAAEVLEALEESSEPEELSDKDGNEHPRHD